MIRILFVCHGNICRSPMAQCIMQQFVDESGCSEKYFIDSKATSTEEIGNGIYPPAKSKLKEKSVPLLNHHASQIKKSDYENFDLIVGMDDANISNMIRIFQGDDENKIRKIREFSDSQEDVDDPWYTDDFETTYLQISESCKNLFRLLEENF